MYRWAFLCVAASLCSAQSEKPKALFPVITAVVNGASFQPGIVSGSWATILGTDLATTTRSWTDADFYLGQLPTALSYTGVIVGGVPAYVAYISATQINFLVADSAALGNVTVLVTEQFNSSNIFMTSKVALAPALFPVAAHNADGTLVTTANPEASKNFGDEEQMDHDERYVRAWEDADLDGFVALLRDDATISMPPWPHWYRGREAISKLLTWVWRSRTDSNCPSASLLLPTAANGQPAFAVYSRDAEGDEWRAHTLQVLTLQDGAVAAITAFRDPRFVAAFGFPEALPPEPAQVHHERDHERA